MKRFGKRGRYVFATLSKKNVTIAFMITFLTSTLLFTCFTPKAVSSPSMAIAMRPGSGYVGDLVEVVGVIDTANGAYKVFFDEEPVANGTASQRLVNTTFLVPHSYQGNHTVKLYDVSSNNSSRSLNFTVNTRYYIDAIMPPQQTQLMEGQSTTIRLNVTGGEANKSYWANVTVKLPPPVNTIYYNNLLLANTTHPGEYKAESVYPRDFGSNAHTNYTGTYTIASNITTETLSLKVGLTNATQYHRFDTMVIQGANYTQQPDEKVWINITSAGKTVFSTNVTAIGGIVNANWTIPHNATYGAYNVTITSIASPKTIKPIPDIQTFNILNVTYQCQIQIKNLDNETVSGIYVGAFNETQMVYYAISNNTGWAKLSMESDTYYFKAFDQFLGVQIGNTSTLNITRNITQTLVCQLVHIKLFITNETKNPLPFITIDLKYNYTRYDNKTFLHTRTLETDDTGIVNFQNAFAVNARDYVIEAKRYGSLFNRTYIGNLTASRWINITCPTYTLFVHVVDSKGYPLPGVYVNVTEWSSGLPLGNNVTDDWASVALNLTFGRYKLRVYSNSPDLDSPVVLNETIIDLTEDRMFETIHCRIFNLSPSVLVIDYFGHPIPNAEVKVERFSEIKQQWVEITPHQRTDSNGVASLPNIGGDYSISIYALGQLSSVKSIYIDKTSMLVFKIDKYIAIGGLILETNQLVVCIVLGLLIILLGIVLTYKKILQKIMKR